MTREEAILWLNEEIRTWENECQSKHPIKEALYMACKALERELNTWSLDDAREDFMHDVYNALDFLPTNEEANRIIDIFDRVTSSIEQEHKWIPVTERLPEPNRLVLCYITTGATETYFLALWNDTLNAWEEGIGGYRLLENDLGYEVIAWMPLPEPHKAESEDE